MQEVYVPVKILQNQGRTISLKNSSISELKTGDNIYVKDQFEKIDKITKLFDSDDIYQKMKDNYKLVYSYAWMGMDINYKFKDKYEITTKDKNQNKKNYFLTGNNLYVKNE